MPAPAAPTDAGHVEAGHVDLTVADGIATLRFGHPKGNSLPGALLRRLAEAVREAGAASEARVVVLRSEGTGPFCAGASFDELRAIRDVAGGKEFFLGFARLILAMRACPKLVLVRVHGKAVGGGVGVAAAADYALAARGASVRLSELAVGIGPFVVGPVIEKRIGAGPFAALAVDAASWRDAEWAERHGLYASVHDSVEALDAALDTLARTLAASSPEAMAALKRVFWAGTEHWDRLLEDRAEMSGTLVLSQFTREAIERFGRR
ncbi:MAG TPA: enoyl-CoA hydratase/isomerase family protein [Gemmatimonadaceae bacterium]|nr:enoyl-CoA hydratase/isomerase family protein [Gemmatimonadaceae bacterium]